MSSTEQQLGANHASLDLRRERGRLHAEVKAGMRSLSSLLEHEHPAVQGVRVYQLVAWLPNVGPSKASMLVMNLPAHVRLRELESFDFELLLRRVEIRERKRRG